MVLDILQHTIRIFRHLEKICLFFHFLYRAMAVRTAAVFIELMLRPVAFAWCAVKPLIRPFINIALGINAVEDLLYDLLMPLLRRADKIIIRDVQTFPEVLEACHNAVYVFNRLDSFLLGLKLDFLSMLITARKEKYIIACQALEPGDGICNRRTIRMPDMKLRTRIIDWCCYVE